MWWGGGGGGHSPPLSPGGGDTPRTEESTTPIPISRGRRSTDDSPLSSSFGSSVGSPSSDLRELRNLRDQFEDQEQLLGQIREALQSSAKKQEKEDYASRLAQMRQKGKGGEKRKASTPITKPELPTNPSPTGSVGKKKGNRMQVLRKQLEETRARQEAEAASRKDLEAIVSNLQREIGKRDSMIASLQLSSVNSSVISSPFVMSPEAGSPNYSPGSITPPFKGHIDLRELVSAKDNKILELSEQVAELGRKVFDLEENLREKDEIISVRTKAVGLAAASVSAKGRNTLDQLEDTREQLRLLQERWSRQEAEWRREREEKKIEVECLSSRLETVSLERSRLEQVQVELEQKGAEQRAEAGWVQQELGEVRSKAREERILLEARLEELEEDRARLQQDLKEKKNIHQVRVSELESRLREAREGGEVEGVAELEICLAEREEEKGNLQLRILELEETISTEGRLKTQLLEVRESLRRSEDDLEAQNRAVAMLEADKLDLMEALATRDDMLTSRLEEVGRLTGQLEEAARARVALEMRCLELEELRDRWEGERLEMQGKIEREKENSREELKPLEEIKLQYESLAKEHVKFKEEHASALEKSKLYDTDLLDKYNKVKELKVEVTSLQSMLQEKNHELAHHFPDIEQKENTIDALRREAEQAGQLMKAKAEEIERLDLVLAESGDVAHLLDLQEQLKQTAQELNLAQETVQQRGSSIAELEAIKEKLENQAERLNQEKEVAEKEGQHRLEMDRKEFEEKLAEKEGEARLRGEECESLKERINSLIEEYERQIKVEREKVQTLEDSVSQLREEIESVRFDAESTLNREKLERDALARKLGETEAELNLAKERIEYMEKSHAVKDAEYRDQIDQLASLSGTMSKQMEELNKEKAALLVKNSELLTSLETLREAAQVAEERVGALEREVAVKEDDMTVLDEDMLAKYKIIEELQTELTAVQAELTSAQTEQTAAQTEQTAAQIELTAVQTELEATRSECTQLAAQVAEERSTADKLRHELESKVSAMETLQTVVDVLKSESDADGERRADLASLEARISDLQRDLIAKNVLIEEFKFAQDSEQARNLELRSKIVDLEKEMADYSGFTEYMNILKTQAGQMTEECQSLSEKLSQMEAELDKKEEELVQLRQSRSSSTEQQQDMVRLQQEQIEMLRFQLREKAELLTQSSSNGGEKAELLVQSSSDESPQSLMSQLTEEVELRVQEVEDVKTLLRRTEAEKTVVEGRLAEVEKFRQELVKESNQHAQETGEKLRELRQELEAEKVELAQLTAEKSDLQTRAESALKSAQAWESKYRTLAEQGSPEVSDLLAQRDSLKEKNDKLKDMCKKYLAKLKQQEALLKAEKYKAEVEALKAEVERLTESLRQADQTMEQQRTELLQQNSLLHARVEQCEHWEQESAEKEQTLLAKDDLIRDLKQRLENSPEDITVPVPEDAVAVAAHERTKMELASIRQKCKKLIVKVKQQDALLKKESAKIRAESLQSDESLLEERSKEVEEEINRRRALEEEISRRCKEVEEEINRRRALEEENSRRCKEVEEETNRRRALEEEISRRCKEVEEETNRRREVEEENSRVVDELTSLRAQLEALHADTLGLRKKISEAETNSEALDALKAKIDSLVDERTGLYYVQVELKEQIQTLKQERQAEALKVEQLQAEVKRTRERNIIAQLHASPLLHTAAEPAASGFAGFEEDDGWGSPEPAAVLVASAAVQPGEDDGLRTPDLRDEDGLIATAAVAAAREAVVLPAVAENGSDGWGGWDNKDEKTEESEQGDGWDDDWGGEVELEDPGQKVAQEAVAEREADIEDGWGDDTWGRFEANAGTRQLAANLRLSEEKSTPEEEGGSAGAEFGTPEHRPKPPSSTLALQCKIAEKESEFESLDEEYNSLRNRFQDLEEHLIQLQESKDEAEKRRRWAEKEAEQLKRSNQEAEQRTERLQTSLEQLQEKIQELEKSSEPCVPGGEELARAAELETLRAELDTLRQVAGQHTLLQERLREAESQLLDLSQSRSALEDRILLLEDLNQGLEDQRSRLGLKVAEEVESNLRIQAEVNQVQEELEQATNAKTDLQESLNQLNQRRNSMGNRIVELENSLERANIDTEEKLNRMYNSKLQENTDLQQRLHALTQEVESLRTEVDAAKRREEKLATEIAVKTRDLENLEAELAAKTEKLIDKEAILAARVEQLKDKEAQLAAKAGQVEDLSSRLVSLQQERDLVDQERRGANTEVEHLRTLLGEMSGENERLQQNLTEAETSLNIHSTRINQLQDEVDRLRAQPQQPLQPPPPPDVTNAVSQPDVARSIRQNPPDIMAGQNVGMPGQMADVMGGQLDLVTDNAASWFDNFADNQGWGDNQPVEDRQLPAVVSGDQPGDRLAVAQADQLPMNQQPAAGDAEVQQLRTEAEQLRTEAEKWRREGEQLRREAEQLNREAEQLNREAEMFRSQLSSSEGQLGYLEREKLMLEETQAQLLTDFKTMYEKCTLYEEKIARLESSNPAPELIETIDRLRQELEELRIVNAALTASAAVAAQNFQPNPLAELFGPPVESAADLFGPPGESALPFSHPFAEPASATAVDESAGTIQILESRLLDQLDLVAQLKSEVETAERTLTEREQLLQQRDTQLQEIESNRQSLAVEVERTAENISSEKTALAEQLAALQAEKTILKEQLEILNCSLLLKNEYLAELRSALQHRDDVIAKLSQEMAALESNAVVKTEMVDCGGAEIKTEKCSPTTTSSSHGSFVKIEDVYSAGGGASDYSFCGGAANYLVEDTLAPAHQLQTAAQFFAEAAALGSGNSDGGQDYFVARGTETAAAETAAAAASFFTTTAEAVENYFNSSGISADPAEYFNTSAEQNIYDPFSQHYVEQNKINSVEDSSGETGTNMLSSSSEVGTTENSQEWYQEQISSYQTAIAEWQVWGEEKSTELASLQEQLASQQEQLASLTESYSATSADYNTAVEQLNRLSADKTSADKADSGRADDKVNEVLKLLKIKDIELEELKETIDRLETEKADLKDEMNETKDHLKELDSASEQVEAYQATLDTLEETKACYDKVREDEVVLRVELERAKAELSALRSHASVEVESLHQALNDKTAENLSIQGQVATTSARLQETVAELERERGAQEEAAAEFEAMQREVEEARAKVHDLQSQLETVAEQCRNSEVLASELEALKQQAMHQTMRRSEDRLAEMAAEQTKDQSRQKISEVEAESRALRIQELEWELEAERARAAELEPGLESSQWRISELESELEVCRQALTDWSLWSENKTLEYNQLLEAYNAYSEAYNTMSTEYNSLKSSGETGNEDIEALRLALTEKDGDISRLVGLLNSKEDDLASRMELDAVLLLQEKDAEISRLSLQLQAKEAELVSKAGEVARLSIRSHLGKLMVHKQEETALAPKPKSLTLVRNQEVSVEPDAAAADWSEAEGWGEDVAPPEEVAEQVSQLELEISQLRQQIMALESARADQESKLTSAKLKNGKLLVKVKTLAKQVENLKKSGSTGSTGLDDLDRTLEDEMNKQLEKARTEARELKKELEAARAEKFNLEKRVDILEGASLRMVELKEQQDGEVEFLRSRSKELKEQVEGLQWQLAEVEERSRSELSSLQVALSAYQENQGTNSEGLLQENARLRQELANISEELQQARQSADMLREEFSVVGAGLSAAREEAEVWRSQALEAREEIESLKIHIDTLENEKGGSEEYAEAMRLNQSLTMEISSLKTLVQSSSSSGDYSFLEQLKEKMRREQQLVLQLEQDLQNRGVALQQAREELEQLRGGSTDRVRRDSTDSRFSVDREVFMEHQEAEAHRLRADLDNTVRENRRLSSRIRSWEQELDRTAVLHQEGLREELSRAIKTLQIKDNRVEELTSENLRLLEERDTLQLRLSSMMRHMESAASSRAMTPVPGATGHPLPLLPVFDPQTHFKMEELRKLNYGLDIDLQRDRDQRQTMQFRVMEPRSRQADQILQEGHSQDSPIKHL